MSERILFDNTDLLEYYFQTASARGREDDLTDFLLLASLTDDDETFRARLRYLCKVPPKPSMTQEYAAPFTQERFMSFLSTLMRISQRYFLSVRFGNTANYTHKTLPLTTFNPAIEAWVQQQIDVGRFRNRSHAVEYALTELIKKDKRK